MKYSDIAELRNRIDGEPQTVIVECNECDLFEKTELDKPLFDAIITIEVHEDETSHQSYDVGVSAMPVTDIEATITVGDEDE